MILEIMGNTPFSLSREPLFRIETLPDPDSFVHAVWLVPNRLLDGPCWGSQLTRRASACQALVDNASMRGNILAIVAEVVTNSTLSHCLAPFGASAKAEREEQPSDL
jgi:hypothetical protein